MESQKFLNKAIETAQEGVMVVDPAGNILSVNPAAEKITGYTAEELVGESCRVLDCSGCEINIDTADGKFCKLFVEGDICEKKCTIIDKNKCLVHVSKNASVLRDKKGEIIGAVETMTDTSELVRQQEEINLLRESLGKNKTFFNMIGQSGVMQQLFSLIQSVSQTDAPVLILGPSGSGKELVAKAIHQNSPRKDKPFVKVNCAALNDNLLESELFGHIKGAYTGAEKARVGRFEAANDGTIFLDEIGDIPLSTQVKLLRVLEENEIERVGDNTPIPINVRIVTATHKDLEQQIEASLFRHDFYFRINVFPITCPSLSIRIDDIPELVHNFISESIRITGKHIKGISPEALASLMAYHWPGNVRELRNVIDYAMVLCNEEIIQFNHLPPKLSNHEVPVLKSNKSDNDGRKQLISALKKANGNQSEAAKLLGVSRVTIWKRIKKFGIIVSSDIK
jgi:two-component system, NtrC family, response regulator HydG